LARAADLAPDNWKYHANLGFALGVAEKCDEAIAAYERAIEIEPAEAELRLRLGWLFEIESRYDDALAAFEDARRVSSENSDAHEHVARMLVRAEKYDDAIVAFQRSIALEETSRRQVELGEALAKLLRWGDAESAFARAVELGDNSSSVRYAVAASMANQQKYDDAARVLREILRTEPDHEDAKKVLSQLEGS
jgi:tetratricopeptide (TPR) repeat protein